MTEGAGGRDQSRGVTARPPAQPSHGQDREHAETDHPRPRVDARSQVTHTTRPTNAAPTAARAVGATRPILRLRGTVGPWGDDPHRERSSAQDLGQLVDRGRTLRACRCRIQPARQPDLGGVSGKRVASIDEDRGRPPELQRRRVVVVHDQPLANRRRETDRSRASVKRRRTNATFGQFSMWSTVIPMHPLCTPALPQRISRPRRRHLGPAGLHPGRAGQRAHSRRDPRCRRLPRPRGNALRSRPQPD